MDAVARLHALGGPALLAALVALAATAGVGAVRRRQPPAWLDVARRVVLGAVVAEAALGLVLALRGAAPAEWIHWLYGVVIVLVLLAPAVLAVEGRPGARSTLLAWAALLAAALVWRLWSSG